MSLEQIFPNLAASGYSRTSDPTREYNCLAWAAEVDDEWWEPEMGYSWPDDIPRNITTKTLMRVYQQQGFRKCNDDKLEPGYQKIAIYGKAGIYEHAARQLPNGRWTSKIGELEDIEHDSLAGLVGEEYGVVLYFMKRRITVLEGENP